MSLPPGPGWWDRTSTASTGSPRRSARRARTSRLPRSPYVDNRSGYTQTIRRCDSVDTVQLRSDVLEGGVVGDHFQPPRGYRGHRLGERRDVLERYLVDLQPDRQVVRPVPGDQYLPAGQWSEVDVEEPGGVQPVRVPCVDRQQRRRLVGHVEGLQPPGRVLGQQQPDRPRVPLDLGV